MKTRIFSFGLVLAVTAMAWGGGAASRSADPKAAARAVRAGFVGKPMAISGLLDGKTFSTAELKGKVVLVHFWASWCPDCAAELPSVIKLYDEMKGKGLEIVGISSDVTPEDLKDYLGKKKEVSWRQLYTKPLANGRHPLNTAYSVDWIPTVFVIDKAGICRSVDGDKELKELVTKLLAEEVK